MVVSSLWFRALAAALCALCAAIAPAAAETAIIPIPASLVEGEGAFDLSARTRVYAPARDAGAQAAAHRFTELMARTRGMELAVRNGRPRARAVAFVRDAAVAGAEAYRLTVTADHVVVSASGDAGLYYGATTLWQAATGAPADGAAGIAIPALTIDDAPRFAWRGLMLDSARHFQSVDFVKRFIDTMALHKLNTLHWHLTDDQGWRIEIRKYPRLTQVGAWRRPAGAAGEETPRYGGFYTQDEIRDVVAYAAARHITIVPEIEMPGHATAAIVAYPQLASTPNPPTVMSSDWGIFPNLFNIDDGTFTFLEDVLTEVMELFPSEFIHVGGDEAVKPQWESNPAIQARMRELGVPDEHHLQSWFITRIDAFLTSKGRKLIGWDEILEGGIAPNAAIMSWRGIEGAVAAAQGGHDAVLTPWPYMYFDNRQSGSPAEPPGRGYPLTTRVVYDFNPAPAELTEAQRAHIIGLQANIWTEHMRTGARVEAKAFPRAAAVAEGGWSPQARRDWDDFARRLVAQLERYEALGVGYERAAVNVTALPSPGADGAIAVELATPFGLGDIRYTTDGRDPTADSPRYESALALAPGTELRAQAFAGARAVGAPQSWRLDPAAAATRASQQLGHCGDSLQLNFEDDAPRAGPGTERAVFNIDVMRPCWIYKDADLTGVRELTAAVGQVPYTFQIGDSIRDVTFRAPATPHGELEARLGTCEGERIAVLPLAPAASNPGVTVLTGAIAPRQGRHDICFSFTARGVDPLYAIDWVRVGPAP